ncbi:hypothetical protein CC85DRAFT_311623 [Cutaneotrichosporon oleaginosum]|uniref:Uncharacterized protein n=1 Tax=Cutaneotrichosporon oleaginosum TaxID=879819 RepID=A0A0J1B7F4_9TREE|nr:uncharacterized protein CC85DRAFT_311623 [Cutaneotrichosporon oleaginosum]KLT43664.1 hypothetical protein CC85DRAFT_311623 [Cutaneotrichosporon oleaginosum]TXT12670.1 hypothetical protein COLE_03080 [Cutaneotrichosporon oleaginosum]
MRTADLRSLSIGVGGLPYPDTRVQAAFRAQCALNPASLAQSPRDSASDYGRPFDARYDLTSSYSPNRASDGWGIHAPERVLTARCACWRHEAALAVLVVEGFAPRRLTRASLRVWEEDERWRALARLLGASVDHEEPVLLTRQQITERICTCPADLADLGGALDAAELGVCSMHGNTPAGNSAYAHLPAEWAAALAAAPFRIDIPRCARPPAGLFPPPPATREDPDPTAALTLDEVAAVRAADASPRFFIGEHPGQGHSRTSSAWSFNYATLNFPAPPPSPSRLQWADLGPAKGKMTAAARHLLALEENATAARALVRGVAFAASTAEAGQGRVAVAVAGTRMARCVAIDVNVIALELTPKSDSDPWGDSLTNSVLVEEEEEGEDSENKRDDNGQVQQDQEEQRNQPPLRPSPRSRRSSRSIHNFPPNFASHIDLRTLLAGDVWERVPHDLVSFRSWPFPVLPGPGHEEAQDALLLDDCLSINEMYKTRASAPRAQPAQVPRTQAPPSPESLPPTPLDGPGHAECRANKHGTHAEGPTCGLGFFPVPSPDPNSTLSLSVPPPPQAVLVKPETGLPTPDSPSAVPSFHAPSAPSFPESHTPRQCRTTPGSPYLPAPTHSVFGAPPPVPPVKPLPLPEIHADGPHEMQHTADETPGAPWQVPPRSLPIWPPPSAPPSLPPSPALRPSPPPLVPPPCMHMPCVRAIADRTKPDSLNLQRLYDALVAGIYALGDRPRTECLATSPVGAPRGPLADEVRAIARVVRRDRRARKARADEVAAPVKRANSADPLKNMLPITPVSSRSTTSSRSAASPNRFASFKRFWKSPAPTELPTAPPTRRPSATTLAPPQLAPPCVTPESAHMVTPGQENMMEELRWALRQSATSPKPKPSLMRFPPHQQGSQAELPTISDSVPERETEGEAEQEAEYEPVLAALEQTGIVVVGVHPAFMDMLMREVAGVSV